MDLSLGRSFRAFLFLGVFASLSPLNGPIFAADPPQESYEYGADSKRQEDVPKGTVTKHTWQSQVFAGTIREYYLYVPARYDASKPAAVMVFQDGHTYVKEDGDFRVPIVFDNLIHQKAMPVTIGIFINPGLMATELKETQGWKAPEGVQSNRSVEYDTLSPDYARFLEKEILPEIAKTYKLTDDPNQRAIGGISSGGICAFTVAWERPDLFRKVLSAVGSFTNIRGGNAYPFLIRKTERKPIRVFLQDGKNDLDNQHGNWPLANQEMDAALRFMNYEVKFVYGEGGHNGKHAGAILPESLRWLWAAKATPPAQP